MGGCMTYTLYVCVSKHLEGVFKSIKLEHRFRSHFVASIFQWFDADICCRNYCSGQQCRSTQSEPEVLVCGNVCIYCILNTDVLFRLGCIESR